MALRLKSGDRVCIVGGGPAGSFAALNLIHFARAKNMELEILIFEPRDFNSAGPASCNRCAGILSSHTLNGLTYLNLALPKNVIQSEIHTYTLMLNGETLRIEQLDPDRRILSVYRGAGPRQLLASPIAGFDHFLLSSACERGAQHIKARVRQVLWDARPVLLAGGERYPADFLVLATGVNSRPPLESWFRYRSPKTAVMAQDEIAFPDDWPSGQVNVFFRRPKGLIFGAMIPKGRYMNISLLGRGLKLDSISDFLEMQQIAERTKASLDSLCGCTPRIAVGSAKNYYGDRWVAVGDAAVTRLYKDGIGAAFHTSQLAMQTAITSGIARKNFQHSYLPFCRRMNRDNQYGKLLFRLWSFTLNSPWVLKTWLKAVKVEAGCPPSERIYTRILWGMFTGDELYRDLFALVIKFSTLKWLWQKKQHIKK